VARWGDEHDSELTGEGWVTATKHGRLAPVLVVGGEIGLRVFPAGRWPGAHQIDQALPELRRIRRWYGLLRHRGTFRPQWSGVHETGVTPLAYVVAQLQGYSLLESPVDVKGVAYEEIVGSNLRGDRGEFFTPRNACQMAVRLLNPAPGSRVVDPACGTGGFLVTAMNHILGQYDGTARARWRDPKNPTPAELQEHFRGRQALVSTTVAGLDIDPNLVRASKMNMVMNNDGSGGLAQADSLREPVTWRPQASRLRTGWWGGFARWGCSATRSGARPESGAPNGSGLLVSRHWRP